MDFSPSKSQLSPAGVLPFGSTPPQTDTSLSPVKLTRDPLQAKDREEGKKATPVSRPSGVILTKPGYFTIPPLDEIDTLVSGGQCLVEGFTVGRNGFGRIHFPGTTDVYGLDLDTLGQLFSVQCIHT